MSNFENLKTFLANKKQYPPGWKRNVLNRIVSVISIFSLPIPSSKVDVIVILPLRSLRSRYQLVYDCLSELGISYSTLYSTRVNFIVSGLQGALFNGERNKSIGHEFSLDYYFSIYIKRRFNPRIIFQFADAWQTSIFLKRYSGATLVNIAHGVSYSSQYFDILDYHYYFVFGRSSIEHLKKNNNSYGSCRVCEVGSFFLSSSVNTKDITQRDHVNLRRRVVYSSEWVPKWEGIDWKASLIETRNTIIQLARRNPELDVVVKLHPLERQSRLGTLWGERNLPDNLMVVKDNNWFSVLNGASFHITHDSNSVLEASVYGVPTIILRSNEAGEDYLFFSRFFPVVRGVDELEKIIRGEIVKAFDISGFIRLHLSNYGKQAEFLKYFIKCVMLENDIEGAVEIKGTYYD